MPRRLGFLNLTDSSRETAANARRRRARILSIEMLEDRALMASFQGLGETGLAADAVSADGSTVVGNSNFSTPFYWKQSTGVVHILNNYSGGFFGPTVSGVSGDGSVIVGTLPSTSSTPAQAFRWTGGNVTPLSNPTSALISAVAVSQDGSTVAGNARTGGYQSGYRLSGASNLQLIPPVGTPGGDLASATAMSADGSTIVGQYYGQGAGPLGSPFAYNNRFIPISLDGATSGTATAVSEDGSVVVGQRNFPTSNEPTQAFRWSQGTATNLVMPSGITRSYPTSVSADGSLIVGYYNVQSTVSGNTLQRIVSGVPPVERGLH